MNPSIIKNHKNYFLLITLLLTGILVCTSSLKAQVKKEKGRVTLDIKDEPLYKVLSDIENQTSFRFAYNTDLILQQKNITFKASDLKISELLDALFEGTSITYNITGNQIVLQKTVSDQITISGYTRDKKSGELLIGTSIYLPGTKKSHARSLSFV